MTKTLKFTQIISTSVGLYALHQDGSVWVYCGHQHGWSKLNMKAMTKAEHKQRWQEDQ